MKINMSRIQELTSIGAQYGYTAEQFQPDINLLILVRPGVQVNIYASTMTIGTSLKHPTKGKTQLFRRGISDPELRKILANPRHHTGKGYHRLPR